MHGTHQPDLASNASPPRWRVWLWRIGIAGVIACAAWKLLHLYVMGNVHAVVPQQIYRGGQLSGPALEALIERHHIGTIVNVRGIGLGMDWYTDEAAVCEARGI